jgi:hypothetical protein
VPPLPVAGDSPQLGVFHSHSVALWDKVAGFGEEPWALICAHLGESWVVGMGGSRAGGGGREGAHHSDRGRCRGTGRHHRPLGG